MEPSLTAEQAYEIQEMVVEERMRGGRKRAGWHRGWSLIVPGDFIDRVAQDIQGYVAKDECIHSVFIPLIGRLLPWSHSAPEMG